MAGIQLKNVSKWYADNRVLENINLDICSGELFSFLGPSGCGKTTLLRIIAGFEDLDGGKIFIGGKDMSGVAPENRRVGMVFQDYCLFPHMNVFDNIAYPLKMQKKAKQEIHAMVEEYMDLVGLAGYQSRQIHQLSGGQQQRVAIARALISQPQILLLDEPLSNLDATLRKKLREELRQIQEKIGITLVFVTHDQEEALSISHRLGIFHQGHLIQEGSPYELYRQPKDAFVATFLGDANLFSAEEIIAIGKQYEGEELDRKSMDDPAMAMMMVRPEQIRVDEDEPTIQRYRLKGQLEEIQYKGVITDLTFSWEGKWLKVCCINPGNYFQDKKGHSYWLSFSATELIPISM